MNFHLIWVAYPYDDIFYPVTVIDGDSVECDGSILTGALEEARIKHKGMEVRTCEVCVNDDKIREMFAEPVLHGEVENLTAPATPEPEEKG